MPGCKIFAACIGLLMAASASATTPAEHDLKAAYIFNILRFVEKRAVGRPGESLTVGVHAAGPIEQSLRVLEGSQVHGRTLRVLAVADDSSLAACEVLFLGRSTGKSARLLAAATALGKLTIGNDADFLSAGGMFALVVESRRIIVEVDLDAVAAAGWTVSSHLLEVARVKGAPR